MITIEDARRIISEKVVPLAPVKADISEAAGRVLRGIIVADNYYPSADRSMMDGYAVSETDRSERFRVVAEVTPGMNPGKAISGGECVRIFTGAILPPGSSQVIIQEDACREGEWMIPTRRDSPKFVRHRGDEAEPGKVLLCEGIVLGPAELAILAQVGANLPWLSPIPAVTHIATGGELVSPSREPEPGQIRDTNSTLVKAFVTRCGASVSAHARIADDLCETVNFASAHSSNILLISGGASVGEHDFGPRALQELGYEIHFDRVNLRPGKPLTFATRGPDVAFVIPGNPVSHFVCLHLAVRLAIERLIDRRLSWRFVEVMLGGTEMLIAGNRDTFWPAEIHVVNQRFVATPKRWSSSGDTFSLAGTNALIRVIGNSNPGDPVSALLLDLPD